jgi:NADH-quinone oxidoreductase subunit I
MSVLVEMVKNLLSKPVTILYPVEKVPVPVSFRGRVCIAGERCMGCSMCSLVCPSHAITMIPDELEVEFRGKKLTRKKRPEVKLFKCIRCGLCERHCPADAIRLTDELPAPGPDREAVVT